MFTHNTLPFADFNDLFGLSILRSCSMRYVGKIPTELAGRVVPCSESKHVAMALQFGGIVGIITKPEFAEMVPAALGLATAANPQASAYMLHEHMCALPDFLWKDFGTRIDPTASIHKGAYIAEQNVVIGAGTVIMAGAIICERSVIGKNCVISPGVVIGCDAFEIDLNRSPRVILKQAGGVWLEDNVEIQSKSTIVRATFGGFTKIGAETKIDCQVHIAHDCIIGQRVRIAACAELSGRVSVGNDTFIGPNCSISNGLVIGENATVTIGAVVVRDVKAGTRVTGNFAVPHAKWLRFIKSLV